MIFRMTDGEIAEVCRDDFNVRDDYYDAIMEVYGVRPQTNYVCDNTNQLDYILGLISRHQTSRL